MELRHLRAVVAVADHLHFGRAAAALGMAQPSLSQTVKALESELGVSLFERSTRWVRLSPAGAEFVDGARTALSVVDSAKVRATAAGRGEAGHLVIGLVGSAATHPMPRIVRAFRSRFPDVTLRFAELPTAAQVTELRTGGLDLGFLRPPLPEPDDELVLVPVSREPLVACLPGGHRLAGRRWLNVRSLGTEPFVLFPRHLGAGLHDEITALCRRAGFDPMIEQEAVQMPTIVGLVAAGCGVSVVPGSVAARSRPDVVFVPLRPTTRLVDLALARPAVGSIAAGNFAALARDLSRAGGTG
ncbi:LysR family transcriptional regulator [Amycolatopsis nigrescens]|uniref:LysR family transcriptional regulator n=1 Tax=Amycolatopsis nigrescens TaxID=381445 RepID=UPI000381B38F|nr:LysR family transcriptional regulator [Amycolatopsis nigrescens]